MVLVFWDTNQNCNPAPLWPLDTLTAQVSIGIQRDLLQWPRELFLTGLTREISNGQDRPIRPARVASQNIPLHYFRWLRSSRMNFRRLLRVSFTTSVTERVKTTRSQAIAPAHAGCSADKIFFELPELAQVTASSSGSSQGRDERLVMNCKGLARTFSSRERETSGYEAAQVTEASDK